MELGVRVSKDAWIRIINENMKTKEVFHLFNAAMYKVYILWTRMKFDLAILFLKLIFDINLIQIIVKS